MNTLKDELKLYGISEAEAAKIEAKVMKGKTVRSGLPFDIESVYADGNPVVVTIDDNGKEHEVECAWSC